MAASFTSGLGEPVNYASSDGLPRKRITIKDVASLAGVSTTTVSHALNDKGRVDPGTRDRVIAIAQHLGYSPSRAARALRTRRTGLIGLVVPTFERRSTQTAMLGLDIYSRQTVAATAAAFAAGYALLLVPPIESVGRLQGLGVDGLIIIDPMRGDQLTAMCQSLSIPFVTIERLPDDPGFRWCVRADNEGDAYNLTRCLADAGSSRIAMLSLDAETAWAEETVKGYVRWCEEHGQEPIVAPASPHDMENSAYKVAGQLLDLPEPPDAILASSERFATAVLRAARERDVTVPDDLVVATGIDGWEAREAVPPVTAVDIHPDRQGRVASELLIARIEGRDVSAPKPLRSEIHVRASTGLDQLGVGNR